MSSNNSDANVTFRGITSSYSSNSRNIFTISNNINNNIIDYELLVRKKYTVGLIPEKDMDYDIYTDEFDPYDYQSELFPEMANFQESNILQGDKSEDDKLRSTYWNDLGGDVFDNWGYFFIYDVAAGKYYFPLLTPMNQPDGDVTTQYFEPGFGELNFTIVHGWRDQGIFMIDVSCSDPTFEFRFGSYGEYGSEGDQTTTDLTEVYGTPERTLYYHHFDNRDPTGIEHGLYTYYVPGNESYNETKPYSCLYDNESGDGSRNSSITNAVTGGIRIYYSKQNDVKDWIINDILSMGDFSVDNGNIVAEGNITSNGTITSHGNILCDGRIGSNLGIYSNNNIIARRLNLGITNIEYIEDYDYDVPPALLANTHFMCRNTTAMRSFRLPTSEEIYRAIPDLTDGTSFRFTINNLESAHNRFIDLEPTDLDAVHLKRTDIPAGFICTYCIVMYQGEPSGAYLLQESEIINFD